MCAQQLKKCARDFPAAITAGKAELALSADKKDTKARFFYGFDGSG